MKEVASSVNLDKFTHFCLLGWSQALKIIAIPAMAARFILNTFIFTVFAISRFL